MERKTFIMFGALMLIVMLAISGCKGKDPAKSDEKVKQEIKETSSEVKQYATKVPEVETNLLDSLVQPSLYNFKNVTDIYDTNNQSQVKAYLNKLKQKKEYTIKDPLVVSNPFGTNTTSLYLYFNSEKKSYLEYTISVNDDTISDFTRILKNDGENNLTKQHEYQLIGLIPEMENTVTLKLYNAKGTVLAQHSFDITIGKLKNEVRIYLDTTRGESLQPLTDGLYFMFGLDAKNTEAPDVLLLYDNDGILRSEIPLLSYRSDRVEWIDGNMFYSYGYSTMCMVNRFGQVIETYNLGDYKQHHDFIYDGKESILILATDKRKTSEEDIILNLNLKTKALSVIVDFSKLMEDIYNMSTLPSDATVLDWIHFNTIQLVNEDELILSSRELSSIISIKNIYKKPKLKYILADKSIWKGTEYLPLLYQKIGEFPSHAGQHTVTYIPDSSLPDGQYYLHLFNNNYGAWYTRPEYDWSNIPGVGKKGKKVTCSMYYKYLVDENKGTYELVDRIDVPYSSIVSSSQQLQNNIITSSGWENVFDEYDQDGVLIKEFRYDIPTYTYRVFKYTGENFWFAGKEKE